MALKSQAATAVALDAMNALANAGKLVFYSGPVPGTADEAAGTALATITPLANPAFSAATTAATSEATLNGVPQTTTVDVANTPTYARLLTSGNAVVEQYTVGAGEDITFDDYVWDVGGDVNLTGLTTQLPVV